MIFGQKSFEHWKALPADEQHELPFNDYKSVIAADFSEAMFCFILQGRYVSINGYRSGD